MSDSTGNIVMKNLLTRWGWGEDRIRTRRNGINAAGDGVAGLKLLKR